MMMMMMIMMMINVSCTFVHSLIIMKDFLHATNCRVSLFIFQL